MLLKGVTGDIEVDVWDYHNIRRNGSQVLLWEVHVTDSALEDNPDQTYKVSAESVHHYNNRFYVEAQTLRKAVKG